MDAIKSEKADEVAVLVDFYKKYSIQFGAGDVFLLGEGRADKRTNIFCHIFAGIRTADGRQPITKILVVLPPDRGGEAGQLQRRLRAALEKQDHLDVAAQGPEWLQVVVAPNLLASSLVALIGQAPPNSVIIVQGATLYSTPGCEPWTHPETGRASLPEDVWAPQLHALAHALGTDKPVYIVLDGGQFGPSREQLYDLLCSVDGWGLLPANDPYAEIAARAPVWDEMINKGMIGPALADIDRLPPLLDDSKAVLKAQLLHKAGQVEQSVSIIQNELAKRTDFPPELAMRLARIAMDAGASSLATRLIRRAAKDVRRSEWLEIALRLSKDIGDAELLRDIEERIASLFPDSRALLRHRLGVFREASNYTQAAALLNGKAGFEAEQRFFEFLAQGLDGTSAPDYKVLCKRIAGELPNYQIAAHQACVRDALRRNKVMQAWQLVFPFSSETHGTPTAMLDVFERILLEQSEILSEGLRAATVQILRYLARSPEDKHVRVRLQRVLSPQVAGSLGKALLAAALLDLLGEPVVLANSKELKASAVDAESLHAFWGKACAWVADHSPISLGVTKPPDELMTLPADRIVLDAAGMLELMGEDGDPAGYLVPLAIGMAAAASSSDPDYDFRLLSLAVGKLAAGQKLQQARDLAEHAFDIIGDKARRVRFAWYVMADGYHRCRNYLEAGIYLGCTLASDGPIDEMQAYNEVVGAARLMRDLYLFSEALSAVQIARELLKKLGLAERYGHRLDTLELGVEAHKIFSSSSARELVPDLLRKMAANVQDVIRRDDETAPVAGLIGQAIRQAAESGIAIPMEATDAFNAVRSVGAGLTDLLISTLSSEVPSGNDLFKLVTSFDSARYSDDVGTDVLPVAMAARRLLASAPSDAEAVVFAIEMLADGAVASPGWEGASVPPPKPASMGEPAAIARQISSLGAAVLLAGLDERGRMVRVTAVQGQLGPAVSEETDVFSRAKFAAWQKKYPRSYRGAEKKEFQESTEGIGVADLPEGPVVVVADVRLQAFPFNLLNVSGDLAGWKRKMAMVPSLAWLEAARKTQPRHDKRWTAWISTAGDHGSTLAAVERHLTDHFSDHNVVLDTRAKMPVGLSGAELTIVVAHGDVLGENGSFQRVSDEGGLAVSSHQLARSLHNVGVVILLVCSGGRSDKHPDGNSVIGLAKELLDQGCCAVIGASWPITAGLAVYWLPAFLDAWGPGVPLIEACYAANQRVIGECGDNPANALGMSLYGDPFKVRS